MSETPLLNLDEACDAVDYRGYSKFRAHNALGPYGRSMPRSIGPP